MVESYSLWFSQKIKSYLGKKGKRNMFEREKSNFLKFARGTNMKGWGERRRENIRKRDEPLSK